MAKYKGKKPGPKRPTLKQQRVIEIIGANIGDHKSQKSILKEAGYSPAIQKNPALVLESEIVKKHTENFISGLQKAKQRCLDDLELKQEEASFSDNVNAIDKLTKTEQLLTGNATTRVENVANAAQLENILDRLGGRIKNRKENAIEGEILGE